MSQGARPPEKAIPDQLEIERKFHASTQLIQQFWDNRAAIMAAFVVHKQFETRTVTSYFDTTDHQLHARDVSLRGRGGNAYYKPEISVKLRDANLGPDTRIEHEFKSPDGRMALAHINQQSVRDYMAGLSDHDLVEVFTTDCNRKLMQFVVTINGKQGVVELALDQCSYILRAPKARGSLVFGDNAQITGITLDMVPEIEIEFKQNSALTDPSFTVAEANAAIDVVQNALVANMGPLTKKTEDKAQVGYLLITGKRAANDNGLSKPAINALPKPAAPQP